MRKRLLPLLGFAILCSVGIGITWAQGVFNTVGPTSQYQHSLPAVTSDTVALVSATQTILNKTFTTPVLTAPSIVTSIAPSTAAGFGVGTAGLPFSNIVLGTAATNAYTITPSSLAAARAITIADPGGAATLGYINNTSVQVVSGQQSFTGNKAMLTAAFTDSSATGLQVITGLSFAIPSAFVGNLAFHCSLGYSEATPAAGVGFGVAALTTAATRIDGTATVTYSAAGAQITGPVTNLTSTTPTAIGGTVTPGSTVVYAAYLDGVDQVAGGGAQTLQFYVQQGTGADVVAIAPGSYCMIF